MSGVERRFASDLNLLRRLAGQPSYSTLERLSGHRLKRATMSDTLNGNRINLPDWRFVHEFVAACRAAATENRLDANELGTIADWKRHWDGAAGGVIDAGFPGHGGQSPDRAGQDMVSRQATPASVPAAAASQPTSAIGRPTSDLGGSGARPSVDGAVARPSVWGPMPSRLPDFVGRETWLETLRQTLTRDGRVGVVAIQGLFGVGKTQLAVEYAHRYADEYDLVWWVPCDSPEAAHGAMDDLAARAGVADVAKGPDGRGYAELFDVLRRGRRYERWLLIFDNVDEPDEIRDLIPPEGAAGHVLVTTRSIRWEASGDMVELDVFDRAESIEFLRRRMRRFTDVAAHRLAEGVGDLPLLLEHAVESHVTVDTYLEHLSSGPLELLAEQPADYHATIASVWATAVDRLRADAADAFDLLRCLAFFGTDPVPRESLERGSHLADVSIHTMLREPIRLAGAIAKLRRAGLLRMRPGTRSLAVHQITRFVVRDLVARSSADEEERARHDVHLLVAAADPLAPHDPATWRSYEELRGHSVAADVTSCQQEMVRRFVVNLVRYLNAAGDPRTAVTVADRALARWDSDAADDSPSAADCRVAMRMAKADALSAQGSWPEAFRLRQEALAAMRSDPGRWTAEIIDLEGTSGARHRMAGDFREALATNRRAVDAHVAEFGDDDPRTFNAVNSLIVDLTLSGSGAEATATAREVHRGCLAFYGDASHPAVLAARNVLGRCLWLSGKYDEAADIMAEVHSGYADLADSGVLDENHPWRLVHAIDDGVVQRDKGPSPANLQVLGDDMQKVRRRCWRTFGADHPQTLAATVVLGSILRRIPARTGEAVRLLEDAEQRYRSVLPGHPYGYACSASLAALRHQTANDNTSPNSSTQGTDTRSALVIQDMVGRLADLVGNAHPLSLTALSALANALARGGELGAAVKRGQEALAGFRDLLGPGHPYMLAVEANVEAIQSRPASPLQIRLTEIDFTPLPL